MILRRLASLSLIALAAACGGSSSSTLSQADAPDTLAKAECQRLAGCCPGTDVTSCTTSVSAQYKAQLAQVLAADVHLTFDGTIAESCLNEIPGWSCEQFVTSNSPTCSSIVHGALANGAACSLAEDCQSALCVGIMADSNGNVSQPGACLQPFALGADCDLNASTMSGTTFGQLCASGSIATNSTTTNACICAALSANGVACQENNECQSGGCDNSSHTCVAYPQLSTLTSAQCASPNL